MGVIKGQGQIFGAVKGSSMKICWVKILTPVTDGSTGTYVVSPFAMCARYTLPSGREIGR